MRTVFNPFTIGTPPIQIGGQLIRRMSAPRPRSSSSDGSLSNAGPGKKVQVRIRNVELTAEQWELLRRLSHYMWWKSPDEALRRPERLMALIMDLADWEDESELNDVFGDMALVSVLKHAEAGWFRPKSWSFWHYRLRLVAFDEEVPPMPRRDLSA